MDNTNDAPKGDKPTAAASSTCNNEVIDLLDSDDEDEAAPKGDKATAAASSTCNNEVIDLLDSDDEDMKPAASSLTPAAMNHAGVGNIKKEEEKELVATAPSARSQSHSMSNAGLAALLRFESTKNDSNDAAVVAAAVGHSGHVGSLRNKHAYLDTSMTDSSKRQRPNGDGDQDCYLTGSLLVDNNTGVYSSGDWIWTHCKNFVAIHQDISRVNDIERFQKEFREKHEKTLTARRIHELIVEIAKKHNVLHGKWLLKVKPESVSKVWPKIRNACIAGKLGSTAKISEQPENGTFMICAYTNNFTDKEDVLRVRQAIHELGVYTKTALHYKPDAITLLGINSGDGDMKGMRPTVYSCGGAATKERLEDYDCECLVESYTKCTRALGCPRCYPKCRGL